jgi:hypothetical protein
VLGGVVEACTEMPFDDFAIQRLFFDSRFSQIRRRVVDKDSGAWYYSGRRPLWNGGQLPFGGGGQPLPDYTGWSAAGGWYVTANQMTDWLHALYSREDVEGAKGPAPLVSSAGHDQLFGSNAFFSRGDTSVPADNVIGYSHAGGTTLNNRSVNGKMSILVGPGSSVHTAFLAANGSLSAHSPFDTAINDLANSDVWS